MDQSFEEEVEITGTTIGVDGLIKAQLDTLLLALEKKLDRDVMTSIGPIVFGADELVRRAIEAMLRRRKRLAVVLDTAGGVVEVVERMVDTLRHHYGDITFIIPDRAMSAGTLFALSGDAILMDYFSVLGPIDPQVEKDKKLIPALAYLVQYDRLIAKAEQGALTTAEMVLLEKLDLGELQQFEEARELSMSLLKKWLVRYKFKDWTITASTQTPVTPQMKESRATEIAQALSDPQRWHSHGRGISMQVLRSDALKLKIDDFGEDRTLREAIHRYFTLLREYMFTNDMEYFIHTRTLF